MDLFSHRCPKTGAFLSQSQVYTEEGVSGKRVWGNFQDPWDPEILALLQREPGALVSHRPFRFSLGDIEINEYLGQGAFGQAYTCVVKDRPMVVKMAHDQRLVETGKRRADGTVPKVLQAVPWRNYTTCRTFLKEIENFERIMEPASFKDPQNNMPAWMKGTGMNYSEHNAFHEELHRMMRHPGYKHMHKILHLEIVENIPLLFSEQCRSSLHNLVKLYARTCDCEVLRPKLQGNEYQPTALWWRVAQHLSSAVDYMLMREFITLDIKPGNILYKILPNGEMLFMVSDYGMCEPVDSDDSTASLLEKGTDYYNPPEYMQTWLTSKQLALFQFATTLISIIDYGTDSIPQFILITNHEYDKVCEYLYRSRNSENPINARFNILLQNVQAHPALQILNKIIEKKANTRSCADIEDQYAAFTTVLKLASDELAEPHQ